MALIKLDLDLAYFRWGNAYYKQLKGFGMGKSTSSPLSDIYMEDFEAKVMSTFSAPDSIQFWLRKADDTLVSIHTDHADALFTHINSIHPDVRWTKEEEVNGKIAMLDVAIQRHDNGTLSFDVYRKPTHTNQYIHFPPMPHFNTSFPPSGP